jgi:hypothetical protein
MSEHGLVVLLREAYENEPVLEKRTAYVLRRLKEIKQGQIQPSRARPPKGPKSFSQVCEEDPVIARLCRDEKD